MPVGQRRNLTLNRTWTDLDSGGFYSQAQVIGNYFYRLRQTNAVSLDRLMEFTMEFISRAIDVNNDGLDLSDIRKALTESVRSNETALLSAVDAAFAAMNNTGSGPGGGSDSPLPPGAPSPAGAPPAPTGLVGTPWGCSAGLSTYSLQWNASPTATRYDGFFRSQSGFYYSYDGSVASAPAYAGANYNALLRIRACNATGCSALSSASVSIVHNLCGF